MRISSFVRRIVMLVFSVASSVVLSTFIYREGYLVSWWQWIIHAISCAFAVFVVVAMYSLAFERSSVRGLLTYAKQIMNKRVFHKRRGVDDGAI